METQKNREINLQRFSRIIKSETWWSEESPAVPLFCQWMQQFVEQSKYWHPKLPNIIFCFIKKNFVFEETPEGQKLKIWNYVLGQYIKRPSVQAKRYQAWKKVFAALRQEGEWFIRNKSKLNKLELAESFEKIIELLREHWRYTWVQESADIFTTYKLPRLIKQENPQLSIEAATNHAMELSSPTVLSFMEKYRVELLTCITNHYKEFSTGKRSSNQLIEKLDKLAKKYIWLLSNYKEGCALTWSKIWQEIKTDYLSKSRSELLFELKQLRSKPKRASLLQLRLYNSLNFSTKLKKACHLLSWWARLIDERKHLALTANWYLENYVQEISRRLKLTVWQVKYMMSEEIISTLSGIKIVTTKQLTERRKLSLYLTYKEKGRGKTLIITGSRASFFWKQFFDGKLSQEIKGQVASAPIDKITGEVQLVLDPHRDKFIRGRILVTTMTRPDFLPLIRRAKAIITDEGGLTCHAAIISRELGIPCIIGTKVASKLLRNGSKIELDLAKGLVKSID